MDLTEIRRLATEYSFAELDELVKEMSEKEGDAIINDPRRAELFNSLVKAESVRTLIDQGMSVPDAIRELGRRMRSAVGYEREIDPGRNNER